MSKARLVITAITVQGMSYRQVAKRYGVSKSWAHKLPKRFLVEGGAGLEENSKAPHTSPRRTPEEVKRRIVGLRQELTEAGVDAGTHTIRAHLARDGLRVSATTGLADPDRSRRYHSPAVETPPLVLPILHSRAAR